MHEIIITGPDFYGKYHPSYKLTPTFFRPICECSSLEQAQEAIPILQADWAKFECLARNIRAGLAAYRRRAK